MAVFFEGEERHAKAGLVMSYHARFQKDGRKPSGKMLVSAHAVCCQRDA